MTMRNAFAGTALALLAGCGTDGHDDLQAFMREAGKAAPTVVALRPLEQPKVPVYEAGGLRDPFVMREPTPPAPPPARARRDPLEAFPLDSLRVVGVIDREGERLVLVRTPTNLLIPARVGSYIGQNFGEVRAIDEGGVEIAEQVPDAHNELSERRVRLTL